MSSRSSKKPTSESVTPSLGKQQSTTSAQPTYQRKRSSSRTHSNYNSIANGSSTISPPSPLITSIEEQPNSDIKPPPALQKFVHVVKLLSPDQSPSEFIKILSVPLSPDSLKIGRQNVPKVTNKITDGFFDSRVLSRNHAELFIKNNKLYIRDLKSSNGTFINDEKLDAHKDYELKIGDKLDLGTTLESQIAHKKITCKIAEFNYISLSDYDNLVMQVLNKGSLQSRKLELFNSSLDALIFSDVIEEQEELILSSLLSDLSNLENNSTSPDITKQDPSIEKSTKKNDDQIIFNLSLKNSADLEDVIRKLILSINNEYIQQQKLKEISRFLKEYIQFIPESSRKHTEVRSKITNDGDENLKKSLTSTDKSEERIKSLETELNLAREHLATARVNETKAKLIHEEHEAQGLKISRLHSEIKSSKESLIKLSKHFKENEANLIEDSNQLKKKCEDLEAEMEQYKETNLRLTEQLAALSSQDSNTSSRSDSNKNMEKENEPPSGAATKTKKDLSAPLGVHQKALTDNVQPKLVDESVDSSNDVIVKNVEVKVMIDESVDVDMSDLVADKEQTDSESDTKSTSSDKIHVRTVSRSSLGTTVMLPLFIITFLFFLSFQTYKNILTS